jgi:hypothetical protein
MPTRLFAKIGFAIAVILAPDVTSALASDPPPRATHRRRIGRVVVQKTPATIVVQAPWLRFNFREPFDYYSERKIQPKDRNHLLNQTDIVTTLKRRGFHDIDTPKRRGSTYITEATGLQGERVRLVVNGKTGGIDGVRIIGLGKR